MIVSLKCWIRIRNMGRNSRKEQKSNSISVYCAVIWGQSKPLDNPDNIHVLIYRCKEMANNCGMCLSLDKKYQCGWCEVTIDQ